MGFHCKRIKYKRARTLKKLIIFLLKTKVFYIIKNRLLSKHDGWIAQLARAIGSYPVGRRFESASSYQSNLTNNMHRCVLFFSFFVIMQLVKQEGP